jgi:hypothetical protein
MPNAIAVSPAFQSLFHPIRSTRAATRKVDDQGTLYSLSALVAVLVNRFPVFILFIQIPIENPKALNMR